MRLLPPSVPPVRGDERGVSRQPTASPNGRDRPRLVLSLSKQANAFGKAEGYADVGAENRKVKVLAEVRSYGRRRNSY